jgi:hypothetical protein
MKGVFGDQLPVYQNTQIRALGLSNEKTLKTKINASICTDSNLPHSEHAPSPV